MEEWKQITDFSEYEVSSLGRVRRGDRILTPVLDGRYYVVCLTNREQQKNKYIHRLMCLAFLPNPDEKRYVDHINRVKTDNRLENLRWATASQNGENRNCGNTNTQEHHITKQKNNFFHVAFKRNCIQYQKNFKTLEEAILWRDENLTQE
jgi:hypothetical protein